MSTKVICWPNRNQQIITAEYYFNKNKLPGVIGAIDGTHIRIDKPKISPDDYIDRKGIVSICLQGICNEEKKFIDVFIGWPGSAYDSRVFKNSEIYSKLQGIVHNDYYLLGDSACPCLKRLIVPYKDNGHLTRSHKQFNSLLSSCRVDIEHCFGILKQRFRQLYYCKLRDLKILCHFVRACCVLHNLADIKEDQELFNYETVVIENPERDVGNGAKNFGREENGKALRDEIRNQILNLNI